MKPHDYALVTVPRQQQNRKSDEEEEFYLNRLKNMRLEEDTNRLKNPDRHMSLEFSENRIFHLLNKYRDGKLSDFEYESDQEVHGIIKEKKKKEKKGKKGKKGGKKGKKKKK